MAAASPGSIIAELLMTPRGGYFANNTVGQQQPQAGAGVGLDHEQDGLAGLQGLGGADGGKMGIAVAAAVSFFVSAFLLKMFGKDASLEEAQAQVAASRGCRPRTG